MKSNRLFLTTMCIFLVLSYSTILAKPWCWTKSMVNDPSYVFDAIKGGVNWGYCKLTSYEEKISKYEVEVYTSIREGSETNSNISIQISGVLGQTEVMNLSQQGFDRGTYKKIEIQGRDVGEVTKLTLFLNGSTSYRCSHIGITKEYSSLNFDCLTLLEPCKPGKSRSSCMNELLPDGNMDYEVTIKTANDKDAETNCIIMVGLIGTKGVSNMKLFSEIGAQSGSTITKTISVNDIGSVTGYELQISGEGKWRPNLLSIRTVASNEFISFDIEDLLLISPGKDKTRFDNNENKSFSSSMSYSKSEFGNMFGVWGQIAELVKKEERLQRGLPSEDETSFNSKNKMDSAENQDSVGNQDENFEGNKIYVNNQTQSASGSSATGDSYGFDINNANGGLMNANDRKGK